MPKPGAATAKTAAPKKSAGRKKANGYQTPEKIPLGEVLTDLSKQQWRIGPSIGAGGFGEIYSACKNDSGKIKAEDYPYVVKVVSKHRLQHNVLLMQSLGEFLMVFCIRLGTTWKRSIVC